MRTLAQQTASRANGARSTIERLAHACGALAGNNPSPRNILRRSLARIETLRRIEAQKKFDQIAPFGTTSHEPPAGPAGGPHYAPEPYSMRLRPYNPVLRISARGPQKPSPPPSHGNPRKTQEKPTETQEKPTETQEKPTETQKNLPPPPNSRFQRLVRSWEFAQEKRCRAIRENDKRVEKYEKVRENCQVIDAQCAAVEDVLQLIRDQSVTMRDPQQLSDHLDSLVRDVEQTEETVREVEAIFESTPLMTTAEFDAPSSTRTRIRS